MLIDIDASKKSKEIFDRAVNIIGKKNSRKSLKYNLFLIAAK